VTFEPAGISRERAEDLLEELAVDRYGVELFGFDGPEWADAEGPAGTPIELKSCALRVRDGRSRRRGRWLIRKRSHERLLREHGRYVLGVYDSAPTVVAVANVSAERVDSLLSGGEWFECASSDQGGPAKQVRYAELFGSLDQRLTSDSIETSTFSNLLAGSP
jgi:hypothetical protein